MNASCMHFCIFYNLLTHYLMELSINKKKVLLQILTIHSDTLMVEKLVLDPDCC